MPETTYTIHIAGMEFETESAYLAEVESEEGSKVTAVTRGDE